MSVYITERLFYDEVLEESGGGVPYAIGNPGDRVKVKIWLYVKWSVEDTAMIFDSAAKTITLNNKFDLYSWLDKGFTVGDTIVVEDSASNDGTYTIAEMDGRVITTVEALSDETASGVSVFGTTPITDLDYLYNLIENEAPESYLSATDPEATQRFTFTGLDASNTIGTINGFVASESFGWVTNTIVDENSGETDEVTIIGDGITADHRQKFIIEQWYTNPMWRNDQINNFLELVPPDELRGENALKHIFRTDARFSAATPEVFHTGGITDVDGRTAWHNANALRTRGEYYLVSTSYAIAGLPVDAPDIAKTTQVTIVIGSRNGQFEDGVTSLMLGTCLCPDDQARYANTPDTTMIQNLCADRVLGLVGDTGQNGDLSGTDYAVISNCDFNYDDVNFVTVTFDISFSSAMRTNLGVYNETGRAAAYWIAIKGPGSVTTTADVFHMSVLCDFVYMEYDQDNAALLETYTDGLQLFEYPDVSVNPLGELGAWEGDPLYAEIGIRVQTAQVDDVSPTIKKVMMQVLAVKVDEPDAVLEETVLDTSTIKKLHQIGTNMYVQNINIEQERGFISYDDDPRNMINLVRDSDNDSGTKKAFLFQYGFVARYEYWVVNLPTIGVVDNNTQDLPVGAAVETVSQRWADYQTDSWELKVRVTVEVEGYDGHTTVFTADADLSVNEAEEVSSEDPELWSKLEYIAPDNDQEIHGLVEDGQTLIKVTYYAGGLYSDLLLNSGAMFSGVYSIGAVSMASVDFDPADPAQTAADFQAALSAAFPGFTSLVEFDGFLNQWAVQVYTPVPGTDYFDITPSFVTLGPTQSGPTEFIPNDINLPADAADYYGYLFADAPNVGSIFTRRFASTEHDSEESTPWEAGPDPGGSISTRADGAVRISIFADRVELSAYFDSTGFNHAGVILIQPRLGYQYT